MSLRQRQSNQRIRSKFHTRGNQSTLDQFKVGYQKACMILVIRIRKGIQRLQRSFVCMLAFATNNTLSDFRADIIIEPRRGINWEQRTGRDRRGEREREDQMIRSGGSDSSNRQTDSCNESWVKEREREREGCLSGAACGLVEMSQPDTVVTAYMIHGYVWYKIITPQRGPNPEWPEHGGVIST